MWDRSATKSQIRSHQSLLVRVVTVRLRDKRLRLTAAVPLLNRHKEKKRWRYKGYTVAYKMVAEGAPSFCLGSSWEAEKKFPWRRWVVGSRCPCFTLHPYRQLKLEREKEER
ncbi:hypothetical protein OPV22_022905 [Ensete ventricosum]|uniref:Uncharacterized protein n=1 Tax=Ensete ventricosum TaxID=4639 RepID=A0AAV8QPH8_ENSVE|nr:hypothetical protein OPV22_022905 [Ensete ventricosum]